jgi:hypothetical protein
LQPEVFAICHDMTWSLFTTPLSSLRASKLMEQFLWKLHSMWTWGRLADIGNRKLPSILGLSDILQWLAPRHQVLQDHFKTTFHSFQTFFHAKDHYTKSVADQLSEDSLLDDLLQKLEELDRSMRGTS